MRDNMRKLFLIGCVFLVAGWGYADEGYRETFDETYELASGGVVSLENINGDVSIEVWERAEVRVHAVKTASSQELLDRLEINVKTTGSAVKIETDYPSTRGSSSRHGSRMEVEYTLTVPRFAAVEDVDLVNGNLTIVGVEGGVQAEAVNGTIVVRESVGSTQLSTVNGGIELYVDRLSSEDSLNLDSVNGSLDLYLSGSAGADIRAESVNGRISTDFGLQVHKGKYVGSDLKGSVGGGGTRVEMETVNGRINVHQW